MQSTMSVVEGSKVSKINKCVKKSVVGVVKKNSITKKNNLSIICCGSLRGDKMMMFRGTTMMATTRFG